MSLVLFWLYFYFSFLLRSMKEVLVLPWVANLFLVALSVFLYVKLFERSEFLIDTSQKKSPRVCTRARVHACSTNLCFSSAVSRVDYAMTERTRQKKQ